MSPEEDSLRLGLYESLLTRPLRERVLSRPDLEHQIAKVDLEDEPDVLTHHLMASIRRSFRQRRDTASRTSLMMQLLDVLEAADDAPAEGVQQLLGVWQPAAPGISRIDPKRRPSTPLIDAALLTNAPGEPSIGSELRAELATCDEVDLLCAFVMWPGLRILEAELRAARDRGVPIRVVTTTYLGGTERQALDRLVRDFGAEVRVQYDARRARLHAKAWLFRRQTGFDTAYIGSSNLSRAALLDGIEWNVRLSREATPTLLNKFQGTFDAYWNSDNFAPYSPDQDRDRLDDALAAARGERHDLVGTTLSHLDLRPYPFQRAILEALESERQNHNRHRNLVVAATGTGKTVMAALDYRNLVRANAGQRLRLLFVAHRSEILQQSLRTYREALADATFGEEYHGGARPERWEHVFASVQSLASYDVANIPADHFDVVVIDEFHHAEAASYRRILEHLKPRELLGLTATPERGDGFDVRLLFDGRTAAELRLWDAINQGLLSPFHYFGIGDNTDLTAISWRNGRYDVGELSNVYTGNNARAAIVLKQLHDKVTDPHRIRALGFCVGVAHAEFMAKVFNEAGIRAEALSGSSSADLRRRVLRDLQAGSLNAVFAADLLNEGVDLPAVDTVLFLRPTESATLFLQQLGRGLRLSPGKDVLTVLDFVGNDRAEFRLDHRFRALTGQTRTGLQRQIEKGFPLLPSGCEIVLDEVTQRRVLENIRNHLLARWSDLVRELRSHPTEALEEFLRESGAELPQVLKQGGGKTRSWTALRRDAGLLSSDAPPGEDMLLRRVRALVHVDDRRRALAYRQILESGSAGIDPVDPFARMLFWTLWPDGGGHKHYVDGWAALARHKAAREEMRLVVDLAFDTTRQLAQWEPDLPGGVPLALHASYQREEILAALGHASMGRVPKNFREGVLFVDVEGQPVDALFITLNKSEADYSPSTMYRDYPISPTLFHWESQSTTSVASPTGQRYIKGGSTVLLFVRETQKNEFGTSPYVFLGRAEHVSHEGDRPIAIVWRLATPMPARLFAVSALAG